MAALAATVAADYQIDTLSQRYSTPFAYIKGAVHSGLTLEGGFAVSRLLGVQVEVTSRPADRPTLRGNPPYVVDLGWLTIVGPDGIFEERRLSRDQFLWLPRDMPQALRFQWSLFADVAIRVTELEAEP